MIVLEENKKFISDVPFSSVAFNPSNVPFYVPEKGYCQKVFDFNTFTGHESKRPYWYSGRMNNVFGVKVAKSLIPEGFAVHAEIKDATGTVSYVQEMDAIWSDANWNVYMDTMTTPVKGTFTLNLFLTDYLTNKTLLAYQQMEAVPVSAFGGYMFFNFTDSSNVLDFPFSSLSEAYQSNGLSFHVKGGVQIGAVKHVVEQEFFRDQRYKPHNLEPAIRDTATLTIGGSEGVPQHVGNTINQILCCDTVFLNGRRIARLADSVPEAKAIAKDYPYVNFTVEIEYIDTNPNVFDVYTNQI